MSAFRPPPPPRAFGPATNGAADGLRLAIAHLPAQPYWCHRRGAANGAREGRKVETCTRKQSTNCPVPLSGPPWAHPRPSPGEPGAPGGGAWAPGFFSCLPPLAKPAAMAAIAEAAEAKSSSGSCSCCHRCRCCCCCCCC